MKKALSILLVLLLAVSLFPAGAMAADVVLSPQNLRVDGKRIECEKYNIDGSNYFKLRDIAMVLSGTGSEFSVGWDGEKKVISVVTGEEYEPNGSELDLSGGDKSATAVPGTQTLLIDGVERGDLSAYNIGGNNYFKLRDLGDALGFGVSYDRDSNTAVVISRAFFRSEPWLVEETFSTDNRGGSEHSVSTCDEAGRPLSYYYTGDTYTERHDYFYDDLGLEVGRSRDFVSEFDGDTWEEHSYTTVYYDAFGLRVKEITVSRSSDSADEQVTEETCSYDDNGWLIRDETVSPLSHTVCEYTRNERGKLLRAVNTYDGGDSFSWDYFLDGEDNTVKTVAYNGDGTVRYTYEYEYANGRVVKETYDADGYHSVTDYVYDAAGNLLERACESSDWDNVSTYTYDEDGRVLTYAYYDGADLFTNRCTYDGEGRLLREEYESPDDDYAIDYSYDAEGRLLTEVYTGSDLASRTEYSYDLSAKKKTAVTTVEYPAATELILSETELTLAEGDEESLYCHFLPYGCAEEPVRWRSSNEVAT